MKELAINTTFDPPWFSSDSTFKWSSLLVTHYCQTGPPFLEQNSRRNASKILKYNINFQFNQTTSTCMF
jgi:hypothetical protein